MVQKQSYLVVADNSGAKEVQVIHIFGSTGKRYAYVGDLVKCAVKKAIPGQQVKKSQIVTGVIVRTRKEYRREDGSYIRFGDNAIVLIKAIDDSTPVGSRIFGPIARELRLKGKDRYADIISRAPAVI
jgi:large subunit ribosomal protein L14